MKHIIYVTPHQLKAKPTLGSIFDWTIAQFYADVCANKGEEVILLHLWNANGLHTINQLQSAGIKPTPTSIETILANNIDLNKKYWIKFGFNFQALRDDQNIKDLQNCINQKYEKIIFKKDFNAIFCPKCMRILSNDLSIKICKQCGTITEKKATTGYFIRANKTKLLQKAEYITWVPAYTKKTFAKITEIFPDEYDLLINKDREYAAQATIHGENITLDPRFTLTLFPAIIQARHSPAQTTLVQGDVLKKGTYYFLTTLKNEDLPTRIIKHGVCLGPNHKKIRRNDPTAFDLDTALTKYDARVIRAYFASRELGGDVVFDEAGLHQVDMFKKTLESVTERLSILSPQNPLFNNELIIKRKRFYDLLEHFEWSKAFAMYAAFIHTLKRKYLPAAMTENRAADPNLMKFLYETHKLYFGGNTNDRKSIQN